jgi:hypothetical protein
LEYASARSEDGITEEDECKLAKGSSSNKGDGIAGIGIFEPFSKAALWVSVAAERERARDALIEDVWKNCGVSKDCSEGRFVGNLT